MRILGSMSLVVALAGCAPSDAPAEREGAPRDAPAATVPLPATDPADGRPVVVFFGTSLTAGLGLPSEDDTYAGQAAELAAAAGVPFTPVHAGVSGETSAAGLRRIDWVLRTPLDVLVLELGANDGLRGLDPAELRDNLVGIVRRTRERYPSAEIVLLGMEAPPNLGERYTSAFRQVFLDVSRQEDTRLVPFFLDGVAGVRELNQSDGIHPTREGHRRMAENILDELMDALAAVAARSGQAADRVEGPGR